MKIRLLLIVLTLAIFSKESIAQCLEITSILINACNPTSNEEDNEMVTFTVGATALNVNDIAISWPNLTFNGYCTSPSSTAGLNATITNGCGYLLEPPGGVIPANANVILITSDNVSTVDNTFSGLTDTLYVIYQCDGLNTAQFVNSPGVGTRTTTFTVSGPCSQVESVTYDRQFLTNTDGERVFFDAAGNATYDNTAGCTAPVVNFSANWAFTNEICNDYGVVNLDPLLASNATTGGMWTGPRVTGNTYDPTGYVGLDSITYTVMGTGTCNTTLDSTIVFSVNQVNTGTANIQSCDSVFVGGTWYTSSTIFTETISGIGYACDSLVDYTIVIDNAITDSVYISGCGSVSFDGNTYTADVILRDTVFGGGGQTVIDTILQTGFEDAEGWVDHSSGNWTQVDANGTWTGFDMYANQFNPNNGIRNVGMNTVGDYLEFPPVDNPQTLYYYDRLSSAPTSFNELSIQYFDGSAWQTITTDSCGHTDYQLVTVDVSALSGQTNVIFRIFRSQDNRSAYIDDITIVGSTSGSGSSCDSISITNIDILDPVSGNNPGNPFLICDTNDSLQLPGGGFAYTAGTFNDTLIGAASNGCDSIVTTIVQTQSCGCFFDDISKTFWIKADTLLQNGATPVTSGTATQWGNIVNNPLVPNLNGLAGGGTRTIIQNEPTFNFNSTMDFANAGFNRGGLPNNAILDPNEGSMFVVSTQASLSFSFVVGTASTGVCGGNRCSTGFRGNRSEFGSDNALFNAGAATIPGVANVLSMRGNATNSTQQNAINGLVGTSNIASAIPPSTGTVNYSVGVGVWPGFVMTGQVAEAIAFNRELTQNEYEIVESYLAVKYGVSLNHSYYASDYTGLSGSVPFVYGLGYDNNIGGIGRDDCFDLEQTISHSVAPGAIVTIALTDNGGSFASPNGFDNNLEFLTWGHNGGPADFSCSTNAPAGFNQLYNREWLSQQTGVVGNTSVAFNLANAGLTGPATDYALVVDTDGDGMYDDETPIAGTIVGNELVFDNVNFDNETFTLVANSFVEVTINDQFCNDSTYTLPSGQVVNTPGTYIDTLTSASSCDSIVTTILSVTICSCEFDLGPDTSFCQGETLLLDAGLGYDDYLWQDNSTGQTFLADATGTYYCTTTFVDSTNNLVVNGDFEQGNTGFTTDYGPGTGGAFGLLTNAGTYAVNTSPANVHNNFFNCSDHTTGSGNLMIVNGSNVPNTDVWCQTINVSPNTDYIFSAWVISLENTNASNVATLNFKIGGVQFGSDFSPSFTACDWQQFSAVYNSGANTTIEICIESDVISGNNDYGIDDIFFTPFCNYTDTINVTVNPIPTPDLGADIDICQGNDTLLDATTANATYLWQDGSTNSATFNAQNDGLYWVDVTVNGCTGRDSVNVFVNPVFSENRTLNICAGDSVFLENDWQNTTDTYIDTFSTTNNCDSIVITDLFVINPVVTTDTLIVCEDELPVNIFGNGESTPGTYIDTVASTLGCDSVIASVALIVNPNPIVSLGNDTTIDSGVSLTLSVDNPDPNETYTWINDLGETFVGPSIIANNTETAEYALTATNEFGCLSYDTIMVTINPLDETVLLIPTAFSPNGDGINDIFRIANFDQFESYILRVYNRWGELIYDNQGYNVGWDGSYQGAEQNIGVYTYYIEAQPLNGASIMKTSGSVSLIR